VGAIVIVFVNEGAIIVPVVVVVVPVIVPVVPVAVVVVGVGTYPPTTLPTD